MRNKVFVLICFFLIAFSLNVFAEGNNEEKPVSAVYSSTELWQKGIEELRGNLGMLIGENQELRQKVQILNNRNIEVENLLKKSEAEKEQLSSFNLKSEEDLQKASKELQMLQAEKLLSDKMGKDNESSKLKDQLNQKISELEDSQGQIESLRKEKSGLEKELQAANKNKAGDSKQLQQSIESLKKELADKNSEIKSLGDKLNNMGLELEAKKAVVASPEPVEVEDKITPLQNQLRNMIKEKEALEDEVNSLKNDLDVKSKIIEELNMGQEASSREKAILESLLSVNARVPAAQVSSAPLAEEKPKPASHEILGYNLALKGKLNQAIEEYKKALSLEPDKKDLYYNLASLYSRKNDFQNAIKNYKEVLDIEPDDKEALYNLSQVYKRLKNEKESKRYYEAYLKAETK